MHYSVAVCAAVEDEMMMDDEMVMLMVQGTMKGCRTCVMRLRAPERDV